MNIAVMGAGAIGAFYGARLAQAGETVTFIARGPHLEAIRANGLHIKSTFGDAHITDARAVNDPAEVGQVDLVLMTVKNYDLEGAARSIAPMVGPTTRILPLLNGVDIVERMGTVLDPGLILGGFCSVASAIAEPGVIVQTGQLERICFGEMDGALSDSVQAIGAAFKNSGVNVAVVQNIEQEIWGKFTFLAPMAGVCSLVRGTMGPVQADADLWAMLGEAVREAIAVGRAKGVDIPADAEEKTVAMLQGFPQGAKPSMALDLERGKPMELDALNGTIVRMGERFGVPTPVNAFIYKALKLFRDGVG